MFLAIETSCSVCSVVVFNKSAEIIYSHLSQEHNQHSNVLPSIIQEIFDAHGNKNWDAIAIGKGPGSYTGLRIGTSLVKGLTHALNIPIIAISSLKNMVLSINNTLDYDFIIPILDARRNEIFYEVYNQKLELVENTQAHILRTESFEKYHQYKLLFIGNAIDKLNELCPITKQKHCVTALPEAQNMGTETIHLFNISAFENLEYYEPNYGKEFYFGK